MLKNKLEGLRQIWRFDNRWHLILTRVLFPHEPLLIYRLKGISFIEDHAAGDECGARMVLTTPMYERLLAKMNLGRSLKVLDIGSNNGGFPLLLLNRGFEIEKLVCVEMNPATFRRLRWNMEHNVRARVLLRNVAIFSRSERLTLSSLGDTGGGLYNQTPNADGTTYGIDAMTLNELYHDTFGADVTDICKMDIERAEYDVFESPACDAIRRCRYLLMEIHRPPENHSIKQLVFKLSELGFVAMVPTPGDSIGAGVYAFRNLAVLN